MSKLLLSIVILLGPVFAVAQVNPPSSLIFVVVAPSNPCTTGQAIRWDYVNTKMWGCVGTTWTDITGGGGGGGTPGSPLGSFQTNQSGDFGGTNGLGWEFPKENHSIFVGTGLSDTSTVGSSYTGHVPAIFILEIDHSGTPDTFKWKLNNGSYITGVPISGGGTPQVLSDGIQIAWDASTGHTLGDKWIITTSSGAQVYSQVADPNTEPTAALIATGTGNVDAGVWTFSATFVTPEGETYASGDSNAVTADGAHKQITVAALPVSADTKVIGVNLYASLDSATPQLADFIPTGTSSYVFNKAAASLIAPPPTFNNLNTAGPKIYGSSGGALQIFDYGVRVLGAMWFGAAYDVDAVGGETILGTRSGFDTYHVLHGASFAPVQMSDGTGNENCIPVYLPNGGLTGSPLRVKSGGVQGLPTARADLPVCDGATEGLPIPVIDSVTGTFDAVIVGGGSHHGVAYCNGTDWVYR